MHRLAALNLRAVIRPAILSLFVVPLVPACADFEDSEDSEDFEENVAESSASVTRDRGSERTEVFEFGDHALYVPACVDAPRAVLIALGGPDTRAFATGDPFGAPIPEVEASLQELGQDLRDLAASRELAILGTSQSLMPNSPESDQLLLDAVRTGAEASGRPKLPRVPMMLYGLSGGAPQASGFSARNPERVVGLFLKVPSGTETLTSGDALGVPTYVVLAEVDAFIDNVARTAEFESNRQAGALWALAMERAVPHHSLSPIQREVTVSWMRTVLARRLPRRHSHPLREIDETSGWLGDRATGETWRWPRYPGDRALATWLPSRATARQWEDLVAAPE